MAVGIGTALLIGGITAAADTAYQVHANSQAADTQADATTHSADTQAQATRDATASQERANAAALDFQKRSLAQRMGDLSPFIDAGGGAALSEANLLGIHTPDRSANPTPLAAWASDPTSGAPAAQPNGNLAAVGSAATAAARARTPGAQPATLGGPGVSITNIAAGPQAASGLSPDGMVTLQAPDGSTRRVTKAEADVYLKLYGHTGLKAVA